MTKGFRARIGAGALAGAAATVIMSAVMLVAGRVGLMGKQPPERVVERGLLPLGQPFEPQQLQATAAAAHVVYGLALGLAWRARTRSFSHHAG